MAPNAADMKPEPIVVQLRERMRLDRFLTHRLARVSRSRIQRHIESGDVLVDGRRVRPSHVLQGGELITLPPLEARQPEVASRDMDAHTPGLRVLYEDDDLLVVDKPAGLVVHPVGGEFQHTLLNALHALFRERGEAVEGVGLVHRLDRLTSGLMVVAKRLEARRELAREVELRRVRRHYLAVALGHPPEARGAIELFIRRDPVRPTRMQALDGTAIRDLLRLGTRSHVSASGYSDPRLDVRPRAARTRWALLRRLRGAALLKLELDTGRTHQIRVHLQGMGMPLLGDPIYGPRAAAPASRPAAALVLASTPAPLAARGADTADGAAALAASRELGRPALHAASLAFIHPRTRETLRFHAALPADLRALVVALDPSRRGSRALDPGGAAT